MNSEAEAKAEEENGFDPLPPPPPRTMEPPPPPLLQGVEHDCELNLETANSTIATDLEATKRIEPAAMSISNQAEVITNDNNQPVSAFAAADAPKLQSGFPARMPVETADVRRSLSLQRGKAWVGPYLTFLTSNLSLHSHAFLAPLAQDT